MFVQKELLTIANFQAWGGGLGTLETVKQRGGIVELDEFIQEETMFWDIAPTETELNDFLWFESDLIFQALGYTDLLG